MAAISKKLSKHLIIIICYSLTFQVSCKERSNASAIKSTQSKNSIFNQITSELETQGELKKLNSLQENSDVVSKHYNVFAVEGNGRLVPVDISKIANLGLADFFDGNISGQHYSKYIYQFKNNPSLLMSASSKLSEDKSQLKIVLKDLHYPIAKDLNGTYFDRLNAEVKEYAIFSFDTKSHSKEAVKNTYLQQSRTLNRFFVKSSNRHYAAQDKSLGLTDQKWASKQKMDRLKNELTGALVVGVVFFAIFFVIETGNGYPLGNKSLQFPVIFGVSLAVLLAACSLIFYFYGADPKKPDWSEIQRRRNQELLLAP